MDILKMIKGIINSSDYLRLIQSNDPDTKMIKTLTLPTLTLFFYLCEKLNRK
jgi:hypothetical protein